TFPPRSLMIVSEHAATEPRLRRNEECRPMIWGLTAVVSLVAVEFAWGMLREWTGRRRTVKRGRTLTAKYGIPWR
ncbi:MAG TPA: hypothetical protein VHT04_02620, partial [Stellaceae bacterium]|nr:hypothetical protein [Stellaceae bacterium]